jgi:hypothetical protein
MRDPEAAATEQFHCIIKPDTAAKSYQKFGSIASPRILLCTRVLEYVFVRS